MDLQTEITRYAFRHPYRAERTAPPKKQPHVWRYVLRFAEQPDQMLAVIAGDVIHNLRSALDHIAVAVAPKNRRYFAGFPIELQDIWEADATGVFTVPDSKRRTGYRSKVEGMPEGAITVIKELQPYHAGKDARRHPLGIVSILDNADKHRQLIVLAHGLTGTKTVVRTPFNSLPQSPPEPGDFPGLAQDGTEIAKFGWSAGIGPVDEAEVDVQVSGTPRIAMDVGLEDGYMDCLESLRAVIDGLRTQVFPALERFVRS